MTLSLWLWFELHSNTDFIFGGGWSFTLSIYLNTHFKTSNILVYTHSLHSLSGLMPLHLALLFRYWFYWWHFHSCEFDLCSVRQEEFCPWVLPHTAMPDTWSTSKETRLVEKALHWAKAKDIPQRIQGYKYFCKYLHMFTVIIWLIYYQPFHQYRMWTKNTGLIWTLIKNIWLRLCMLSKHRQIMWEP